MTQVASLPCYDRTQTYAWNYEHAPSPVAIDVPRMPGDWNFCGLPVDSPLGIAAGPLLNGKWLLYYAALGFDVLTYKTVRSSPRSCYPLPNLQPVHCGQLHGDEHALPALDEMAGSWAVSFGMPSQAPAVWRDDIAATRRLLPPSKCLCVSVVGTVQPEWSVDDLADDYANCARWAVESGADSIEMNFSCPNVSTCDGQLYQHPDGAARVAQRVRAAIGQVPLLAKIGHLNDDSAAESLLLALAPHLNGLSMTNSVAATVIGAAGSLLFDGQRRGICGDATRQASLAQIERFALLRSRHKLAIQLIGVGGASTAEHVQSYLDAGADAVHLATAVMVDPQVGLKIRHAFSTVHGES